MAGRRRHGLHVMRALIFDFDGLIVDTESAIYEAWRELYRFHGHDLLLETYVQCVGSTFSHYDPMAALETLTDRRVAWEEVLPRKDARIVELQRGLDTMPGIRALLVEAERRGIPCAVASSSSRAHVTGWLERTGIAQAFAAICTRDDVARAKPAPDLFLAASERLELSPRETLVLEDSTNGLRAARAASAPCVIVPSPVTRGSDFTGAAAIIETLEGMPVERLREIHAIGAGLADLAV
jgi:putative hydrolase of the HAD superfamily